MLLNLEQINNFNQNGYIIIDNYADIELCNLVIGDMHNAIKTSTNEIKSGIRIADGWTYYENIRALATNQIGLKILQQLFGANPFAFQTLNFPIGTQQKIHSDTIHFDSDPSGYMAGIWVALEDVDTMNGPLVYYPGSHKLPYITMKRIGVGNNYGDYKHYENYVANLVKQKNLQKMEAHLKKGQALIWHARLLHGGAHQKDKTRSRYSQVTHYFFEGMEYKTPMLKANRNPPRINMKDSYYRGFNVVSPNYLQ